MDGRPPEVVGIATGEALKLACMACIRGHRTKHCGGLNCRDKILWTIKRPGRPSNSCMCKYSGTGQCKCVLAKAQCPHKPKKGEKRTVDCRCDERGRYCCTLSTEQWGMLAGGEKPRVKMHRNLEELERTFSASMASGQFDEAAFIQHQHSPFGAPRTPATSIEGFSNHGSGVSTPQLAAVALHHPDGVVPLLAMPESPAGPPRARFGMMGLGAPMGGEDLVGQDVLAWHGQTPIASTSRPSFPTPPAYHSPPAQVQSPFPVLLDPSLSMESYKFMQQPSQHRLRHQQEHTPATPLYQTSQPQHPQQPPNEVLPPVTAALSDISGGNSSTVPALSGFDMDYFNFQLPSAICQNCSMADCTCRQCPTVLQSTFDGSWRQCCSRKHSHAGPATAAVQTSREVGGSCCGSKGATIAQIPSQFVLGYATPEGSSTTPMQRAGEQRGGCCAGSNSRAEVDNDALHSSADSTARIPFDDHPGTRNVSTFAVPNATTGVAASNMTYDPAAPTPPNGQATYLGPDRQSAQPSFQPAPIPQWTDPSGDISIDFDEFIQEMGCGCGTDCPCGMDDGLGLEDSLEMDLDDDPGGGVNGADDREEEQPAPALKSAPQNSCCGGR